ncbi:MAG: FHA domain-containing protein [Polyangia bacterium]|jgi:hypothetical protein
MDQSKKTMRHFYCRDALWETFEAMAADFDCSVDYLINEAMRIYARSKNYQVGSASGSGSQISTAGPGPSVGTPSGQKLDRAQPTTPSPVAPSPTSAFDRPPSPDRPPTASFERPPVPATNLGYPPPRPTTGTMPRANALPPPPPPPPSAGPPTPPTGTPGWGAAPGSESPAPPLFLLFQGQRILIDKDQFVIGRGSKTADLAIKDGNISRQHAVVLRRNGVYYIKDLGSTNGIEFKGMRIDNKRIDEGDTFFICDFELRFTYQP